MGFMILTESGHIAIATAIKDQIMFLAWGDLPPYLNTPTGLTITTAVGNLAPSTYRYKVTALGPAGETLPTAISRLLPQL